MAKNTRKPRRSADLSNQTVLFRWAMGQIGVDAGGPRPDLLKAFRDAYGMTPTAPPASETPIADRLSLKQAAITPDVAVGYEQNLAQHTLALNERRLQRGQRPIRWTYFQHLGLFLTERFLDRFFSDPAALREELNAEIRRHNEELPKEREAERLAGFDGAGDPKKQLARLGFWCATGSGKTLLMHANIRQFRHWHAAAGRAAGWPALDRVLVVTPNAGLTHQHAAELEQSGFRVGLPGRDAVAGLSYGRPEVEVVEIHKLQQKAGPETLAVAGFTGCNLVLVDEGHTGLSGKEETGWRERRATLAEGGFLVEYSATFKEALEAVGPREQPRIRQDFATSLLIDYSYPAFYRDGYGKDFEVLNLEKTAAGGGDADADESHRYLTLALLRFARQLTAFEAAGDTISAYGIDKPLWMFVGGTVVGSKETDKLGKKDASDLLKVLRFFAWFVSNREGAQRAIGGLLRDGFKTRTGRDLMTAAGGLAPLTDGIAGPEGAATLRERVLSAVFGTTGGGTLRVRLVGGATGELAVSVGGGEPFGVAYVGDAAGLAAACRKADIPGLFVDEPDPVARSLFARIDAPGSPVNLLLGAKKFAEGWNSYRVSSLGLMNVGKKQGAQIVQLFGRGVRLRGENGSMRRSDDARRRPKHLGALERLQVAGVHADAMDIFQAWVRENTPEVLERQTFEIDVIQTRPRKTLRTLGLPPEINGHKLGKNSRAFAELGPLVRLAPPGDDDDWLRSNPVSLDLMPRVAAMTAANDTMTREAGSDTGLGNRDLGPLSERVVSLLDVPALVAALEAHKAAKGLERLHVDAEGVRACLWPAGHVGPPDWYTLAMPADRRRLSGIAALHRLQAVAERLLCAYAEKLVAYRRQRWEAPYLEVREVTLAETREGEAWEIEAPEDQAEQVEAWVKELRLALQHNPATAWRKGHWGTAPFGGHLYQPLLMIQRGAQVKTRPVALDANEEKFVADLRNWCEANPVAEVHLLRNEAVKGKGLGFFEAGNFHPDFLLWRLDGGRERLAFVDPKGLRNHRPEDDKVTFATKLIPRIQQRLNAKQAGVELSAFLLSNTPFAQLRWSDGQAKLTREQLKQMHVLFDEDDDAIAAMMDAIG